MIVISSYFLQLIDIEKSIVSHCKHHCVNLLQFDIHKKIKHKNTIYIQWNKDKLLYFCTRKRTNRNLTTIYSRNMYRQRIQFTKMHGAGNDYIYVNTLLYNIENPEALAIKWSDRHKGIGSDGLVLICKPDTDDADYKMRIFNADGSEDMMCGNA